MRVCVADRHARPGLAERVGAKLCSVLPLPRSQLLGAAPQCEVAPCPDSDNAQDSVLAAFGLLCARVAEAAGVAPMPARGATYVHDVRLAAAEAFADLREKVDGALSSDREVVTHLADAGACRAWLAKLVSKPELVLRSTRLPAPERSVHLASQEAAPVEPLSVLTWNVNQKHRPKSVQAPADEREWSAADNLEAVQAEILRWRPGVASLQECANASPLRRLLDNGYAFLCARPGHDVQAGYVHLYARRVDGVDAKELKTPPGVPGVLTAVVVRGVSLAVVALHLAASADGKAKRERQLRRAVDVAQAESDTVVVLGDLNLRDAELVELPRGAACFGVGRRAGLGLREAAYSGCSWHPQANRYSDEEGYATRQAARFDRVLFLGAVFGCAYLVGRRKQFHAGKGFFLSDHFAVCALLDVDLEHSRVDATKTSRESAAPL